jgi:hypothetical protein
MIRHNAGSKIIMIPGDAVRVTHPAAAAAIPWYLAGGATGCDVAYQAKGAASYAASKVNLANPGTYDAADAAAFPSWNTSTGWLFTPANSEYLTTGYTPPYSPTGSIIIRLDAVAVSNNLAVYQSTSGKEYGWYFQNATTAWSCHGASLSTNPTALTTDTVLAIAGNKAYQDGNAFAGTIAGPSGAFVEIRIGSRSPTAGLYWNGYILAMAVYTSQLTPEQVTAITSAMAAL